MPQEFSQDQAALAARAHRRYWASTVRCVALLLSLWFAAGLGAGVLFADRLNAWQLGGFPLGFWFAQQGSMLMFLVLIGAYALIMGRLDRRLARELAAAREGADA